MLSAVTGIGVGVLVVLLITVITAYFVAQEFGFMVVDRSRLRARAGAGDVAARRALDITERTSFMLSGAQLGITVTGLVVGYVAEPMIGEGLAELLGMAGVPAGVGIAAGTAAALLLATVVQMVFGELVPKNLAIARPEPMARRLALSTGLYLAVFGWVIRVFDAASNALLRVVRIEQVHDVEHAATARDLEAIIGESRDAGDLPPQLSALLDRVLEFGDRRARGAMVPRPKVATVPADQPLMEVFHRMGQGHSRYPVVGEDVDEVLGVVCLRDVLRLDPQERELRRAAEVVRAAVFVPDTLPLTQVLDQLREAKEEFACVLDEYGGLAGIITVEDIAEELVGEITDEHDPAEGELTAWKHGDSWILRGAMRIDEVERFLDRDLPGGPYHTVSGLVLSRLGRLPVPGDVVLVDPVKSADGEGSDLPRTLRLTVLTVARRVPELVELRWTAPRTSPRSAHVDPAHVRPARAVRVSGP